jgi:hypothetical protein
MIGPDAAWPGFLVSLDMQADIGYPGNRYTGNRLVAFFADGLWE